MKNFKIICISVILSLVFSITNVFGQLKMDANGNIGIGSLLPSSSYNLNAHTVRFLKTGIAMAPMSSYSLSIFGSIYFDNSSYNGIILGSASVMQNHSILRTTIPVN